MPPPPDNDDGVISSVKTSKNTSSQVASETHTLPPVGDVTLAKVLTVTSGISTSHCEDF